MDTINPKPLPLEVKVDGDEVIIDGYSHDTSRSLAALVSGGRGMFAPDGAYVAVPESWKPIIVHAASLPDGAYVYDAAMVHLAKAHYQDRLAELRRPGG